MLYKGISIICCCKLSRLSIPSPTPSSQTPPHRNTQIPQRPPLRQPQRITQTLPLPLPHAPQPIRPPQKVPRLRTVPAHTLRQIRKQPRREVDIVAFRSRVGGVGLEARGGVEPEVDLTEVDRGGDVVG